MMQSLLVRAADVHARAAPDGLEPLQHLDVGGGVALGAVGDRLANGAGHGLVYWLLLEEFGRLGCRRWGLLRDYLWLARGFLRLLTLGVVRLAE